MSQNTQSRHKRRVCCALRVLIRLCVADTCMGRIAVWAVIRLQPGVRWLLRSVRGIDLDAPAPWSQAGQPIQPVGALVEGPADSKEPSWDGSTARLFDIITLFHDIVRMIF